MIKNELKLSTSVKVLQRKGGFSPKSLHMSSKRKCSIVNIKKLIAVIEIKVSKMAST